MPVAAVAMKLGANLDTGLSRQEARLRATRFGANVIEGKPPRSLLRMFFDQFADFMIIILIAAAVVSSLVGDLKDVVVILVIVVLNAIIGFVQEYRAERAMAALTAMAASNARVIRGEQRLTLPSPEVVPGDIVLLEAGDVIPADVRLVEAVRLKADESVLSGESVPVEKHARAMPDVDVSIGDCLNMGFKGTTITYGRGRGVVTSTGMETEFGKIAALSDRRQPCRCSDPGSIACGRHDFPCARRPENGEATSAHPAPAGGGDAGFRNVHLCRQDGHSDAKQDASGRNLCCRCDDTPMAGRSGTRAMGGLAEGFGAVQ
jgi:magnesium-transporting ATPase (P-type)